MNINVSVVYKKTKMNIILFLIYNVWLNPCKAMSTIYAEDQL